jgi:hypothetical protein
VTSQAPCLLVPFCQLSLAVFLPDTLFLSYLTRFAECTPRPFFVLFSQVSKISNTPLASTERAFFRSNLTFSEFAPYIYELCPAKAGGPSELFRPDVVEEFGLWAEKHPDIIL